jgi:hypothetical protein
MRTNLIMHFHCSECGNQLKLKNESEGAKKPVYHDDTYRTQEPKEPTGAACYYTPKISIEPCKRCIEKYTKPAKQLVDAINIINNGDSNNG